MKWSKLLTFGYRSTPALINTKSTQSTLLCSVSESTHCYIHQITNSDRDRSFTCMLDSEIISHSSMWQRSTFKALSPGAPVSLAVAKTRSPRFRSCVVNSKPMPREAPTINQVEVPFMFGSSILRFPEDVTSEALMNKRVCGSRDVQLSRVLAHNPKTQMDVIPSCCNNTNPKHCGFLAFKRLLPLVSGVGESPNVCCRLGH